MFDQGFISLTDHRATGGIALTRHQQALDANHASRVERLRLEAEAGQRMAADRHLGRVRQGAETSLHGFAVLWHAATARVNAR